MFLTYLNTLGNTLPLCTRGSCMSWQDMGLVDKLLRHAVWVSGISIEKEILDDLVANFFFFYPNIRPKCFRFEL